MRREHNRQTASPPVLAPGCISHRASSKIAVLVRALAFLLALSLQGASFYVSSAGNDANDGSSGSPWKTLAHAVDQNAVNTARCGDTINIVANGSYVVGDAFIPALPGCGQTTTIQSSALSTFLSSGYRTNPVRDGANYGKLSFSVLDGLKMESETHGFDKHYNPYCPFDTTSNAGFFTIQCAYGLEFLANGSQIEFEPNFGASTATSTPVAPPAPLSYLTHYFVVNLTCVASGNFCINGSKFQVSATSGGSPITITSCNASCQANAILGEPIAVNTSTSVFTSPRPFVLIANDSPVSLVSGGLQIFGVIPSPLQLDTSYYIVNLSGQTFQLAATPGGSPITITTPGTGMVSMSNDNVAHNWAFRGLELFNSNISGYLIEIGDPGWTNTNRMVNHIEVDRLYMHGDDVNNNNTLVRCMVINARYVNVRDSYCSGATYLSAEAQGISFTTTPGPIAVTNNFIEAATEGSLGGGDWGAAPAAVQNILFTGNYYYKPPMWKYTSMCVNAGISVPCTGAASGPCLYDDTDPLRIGGEWYLDSMTMQKYQCGSDRLWHTTSTAIPAVTGAQVKDMYEHKNGRYFTYIGNISNYSFTQSQAAPVNNSQELGSGPGMADDHITMLNNAHYNAFRFMTRTSQCNLDFLMNSPSLSPCIYLPTNHNTTNNLITLNPLTCGVAFMTNGSTCGFFPFQQEWSGSPTSTANLNGDIFNHNTIFIPDGTYPNSGSLRAFSNNTPNGTCTFSPYVDMLTFTNTITDHDFAGDCATTGGPTVALYFTHSALANNALRASGGNYSSMNIGATNSVANQVYPADNTVIKYVNCVADTITPDCHLDTTSPYSAANAMSTQLSTDGTDIGADIDLINLATSGAAAGTPPWDQMYNVHWSVIGSTKAVLAYTAPTSAACTATIYNTAVRNLAGGGNIVATSADSAAASVSDGTRRENVITGLSAATNYPAWKLVCGGGVVIVGQNLTTRAAGGTLQFPFQVSVATPLTYGTNHDLSGGTTLGAATTQYVPVATNATIYSQFSGGQLHVSVAP